MGAGGGGVHGSVGSAAELRTFETSFAASGGRSSGSAVDAVAAAIDSQPGSGDVDGATGRVATAGPLGARLMHKSAAPMVPAPLTLTRQ